MTPVGEMEKSGVGIHPFQKFNNTNGNAGGQTKRQMSEKQKQKFVEQVNRIIYVQTIASLT